MLQAVAAQVFAPGADHLPARPALVEISRMHPADFQAGEHDPGPFAAKLGYDLAADLVGAAIGPRALAVDLDLRELGFWLVLIRVKGYLWLALGDMDKKRF